MKKRLVFVAFLSFLCALKSQNVIQPITFDLSNFDDDNINIIGLNTVNITINNNTQNDILINEPKQLLFEVKFLHDTTMEWLRFNEGNFRASNRQEVVLLESNATIFYKGNVNFFEVLRLLKIQNLNERTTFMLRCGIFSNTHKKILYSAIKQVDVEPLSTDDLNAIGYIDSLEINPYSLTRRSIITVLGMKPEVEQNIMNQFPLSSFAEIAFFNRANKVYEENEGPQTKLTVLTLLEKPLASKFSFIRLLAEELKMKL